jgi:hypothetical protein
MPSTGARRGLEFCEAAATLAQGDPAMAAHADAALAILRHSPVKGLRLPGDHDKENAAHRNARSRTAARADDDEESRLQSAWDVIRKVCRTSSTLNALPALHAGGLACNLRQCSSIVRAAPSPGTSLGDAAAAARLWRSTRTPGANAVFGACAWSRCHAPK